MCIKVTCERKRNLRNTQKRSFDDYYHHGSKVFCTKKPIFVFLDAREMGRERKHGGGGRGEEVKETLARKPHDFLSSDRYRWNRCPSTTC